MKKLIALLLIVALTGCTTQAIETTYDAQLHRAEIQVDDLYCPSCSYGVEYQLKQIPGVVEAKVSYPEGNGYVIYDANVVTPEIVVAASDVYPATVIKDEAITNG